MDIPPRQTTRQVYDPVNRCIYCGAIDDLRMEHIIPFALGGIMELPKSSCAACEKITHTFEFTCCRQIFGKFRIRHGLPTRRKKERPKTLDASVVAPDGTKKQIVLSASEYPTELFLYKFKMAGALLGGPPDLDTLEWVPVGIANNDEMHSFEQNHGGKFSTQVKMLPIEFGRMLAKIGHSFAVASVGLNAFKPMALDVILGRTTNISHVVGGSFDIEPPVPDAGHLTALEYRVQPYMKDSLIVVHIRLFASAHTPSYHVVVGRIQQHGHVSTLFDQIEKSKTIQIHLPPGKLGV